MEHQHSNLSLSVSIQACQRLTAKAHSNFAPAFAMLPAAKRQAMEILYAYTRFTDDLVDMPDIDPASGKTLEVSPRRRKQKLNQWVSAMEAVFGRVGDETIPQIDPSDESAFQEIAQKFPGCAGLIFLPALKMIVDNFKIPREPLYHLIDGVESDMTPKPFATFDHSIDYCHQVATSVGFASLAIWGTNEPLFSEVVIKAAKACGIAFQWTNIIRDMLEDYRNGRIYLPQSELQRFGLTEKQFGALVDGADWAAKKKPPKKGENSNDSYGFQNMIVEMEKFEEKFFRLMVHQLNRCEIYYENSIPLYRLIHRDSQRTFGMMWSRYYALYRNICRNPLLITRENRVRLSFHQRLWLWFRWHWMPCRHLR